MAKAQPRWLDIGPYENKYTPHEQHPFFGAMLLPAGRKALGRYAGTTAPSHTH